VPLPAEALRRYRGMVEAFRRRQLNTGEADGRKLSTELEAYLREAYEAREGRGTFASRLHPT
jgi:hypothetical protein